MRRMLLLLLSIIALAGVGGAGDGQELRWEGGLSKGLDLFLEARLAEVGGEYRKALDLYARALEAEPERTEVRVSYAALLVDVGMYGRALAVLDPAKDLDWYGLRTRGMALAQLASRDPDRLAEAELALRAALEDRPGDLNIRVTLAQILSKEGKLADAEVIVREIREKRSDNPRLLMMHAELLRGLGRREEAVELYRRCAADGPLAGGCRGALVDLLEKLGKPLEAADTLAGSLADDDLDQMLRAATLYGRGGRPDKGLPWVRKVLAAQTDSPRAGRIEAILLSALGRYGEAAGRLTVLHRKHPDNTDVALSLAWAWARSGRTDEARKLVAEVWKEAGRAPRAQAATDCALTGARIELLADRVTAAREWLDRIPDPTAGGVDLVRLTAETYRRAREWKAGVGAMLRLQPRLDAAAREEAVASEVEFRLQQHDSGALDRLQGLLRSADVATVRRGVQVLQIAERWADVEREARVALAHFPGDRDLTFARGAALERLGRSEESAAAFEEILDRNPDDADVANYLGYMWADAGVNLPRALALIGRAVELRPGTAAFLDSLGWVHFRLGHLEEAERWLRRAIEIGPPDGTVMAHLGEVMVANGQAGEARRYLQRGIELGCENPRRVQELIDDLGTAPREEKAQR